MQAKEKIKQLTKKKFVYFLSRGDEAIKEALKYAKSKGKDTLVLADQGGWMSYKKFGKRLGFSMIEMETDFGIVELDLLGFALSQNKNTVLLLNSFAGYHAEQPVDDIITLCKKYNCLFVNDASGTIGTDLCRGDIIVASLGEWKAVDLGEGGILAIDEEIKKDDAKLDEEKLLEKLNNLPKRFKFLFDRCEKIKEDLKGFDVIHPDKRGIVVIVRFRNEEEKNKLLKYCEENKLEHTLCPREIRVKANAVSIEVKRLNL